MTQEDRLAKFGGGWCVIKSMLVSSAIFIGCWTIVAFLACCMIPSGHVVPAFMVASCVALVAMGFLGDGRPAYILSATTFTVTPITWTLLPGRGMFHPAPLPAKIVFIAGLIAAPFVGWAISRLLRALKSGQTE